MARDPGTDDARDAADRVLLYGLEEGPCGCGGRRGHPGWLLCALDPGSLRRVDLNGEETSPTSQGTRRERLRALLLERPGGVTVREATEALGEPDYKLEAVLRSMYECGEAGREMWDVPTPRPAGVRPQVYRYRIPNAEEA